MFYVGQKVVCVKPDHDGDLVKDHVYTVSQVVPWPDGISGILVKEVEITGGYLSFDPRRFAPVQDNFADTVLAAALKAAEKKLLVHAN